MTPLTGFSLVYNDYSHRIRIGDYNRDEMTDDYEVVKWDRPTDMPSSVMWFRPVDPSGVVHDYGALVESLDGRKGGFGKPYFSWYFSAETPGMIIATRTNILGSASALNASVTVMSWSRLSGWICCRALAVWNEPADVAEPKGLKGFKGVKIDFVECVDAPET